MPTVRPITWADRELHQIKRELSRFEKATLLNTRLSTGQAIIMPAVPGTEVEELLAVGFDMRHIQAVEEDQRLADALYEHYWDEVSVHWEEISTFLRRARSREGYSYIHLDYCGHLRQQQIDGIEAAIQKLADHARLRCSIMLSRRPEDQQDIEYMVAERILRSLVSGAKELELASDASWDELLERVLVQRDDPTITVGAIIFLNAVFGLRAFEYTDACVFKGHPFLPRVSGRHRIISMRRFHYNEATNANVMGTIWVNVAPQVGDTEHPELAIEELMVCLRALGNPSIPFLNPALFE